MAAQRPTQCLPRMDIAEKIGQMILVEVDSVTPVDVREACVGGVLNGGGSHPEPNTPRAWADQVRMYQDAAHESRTEIPILYGVDAVHCHNNVDGATIFPHNIGLGATRDAALLRRIGRVTACELLATNIRWDFAPAVSVPQDIRWGRTYEGFSEEPELVSEMAAAFASGLTDGSDRLTDGQSVLPTAKHFVGDGGTAWASTARYPWIPGWWQSAAPHRWQIDQGDTRISEQQLRLIHLRPFEAALGAGVPTVMASYSSWNGVKTFVAASATDSPAAKPHGLSNTTAPSIEGR